MLEAIFFPLKMFDPRGLCCFFIHMLHWTTVFCGFSGLGKKGAGGQHWLLDSFHSIPFRSCSKHLFLHWVSMFFHWIFMIFHWISMCFPVFFHWIPQVGRSFANPLQVGRPCPSPNSKEADGWIAATGIGFCKIDMHGYSHCICEYVYMYTCIYVYMYTCFMYICIYVKMYICINVCVYI